MRAQDKPVLDAALSIAKNEGRDITSVFRIALAEFVKTRSGMKEGRKMDEFLDDSSENPLCNRVLTPEELRNWSEAEYARRCAACSIEKRGTGFRAQKKRIFLQVVKSVDLF